MVHNLQKKTNMIIACGTVKIENWFLLQLLKFVCIFLVCEIGRAHLSLGNGQLVCTCLISSPIRINHRCFSAKTQKYRRTKVPAKSNCRSPFITNFK